MDGRSDPGHGPRPPRVTAVALASADACLRRLWLHQHEPGEAAPASAHGLVLRERGDAHERALAARFADLAGPVWTRAGSFADAAAETLRLLRETRRPISQAALLSSDGRRSGVPDILYWDGDSLIVLDAKLALRPETRRDFALQMAHYRALLEDSAGLVPARCEIVNGYGETCPIAPIAREEYESAVREAEATLALTAEPDLLLAHSTCKHCAFYAHCWDRAERERRIEILPEVQSRHVPHYHALGVRTIADLASLDPRRMPGGPLRAAASRAVRVAAAWHESRAEWMRPPRLPQGPIVWFDLEGDSRGEDAEIPIYLWGFALEAGGGPPHAEAIFAELSGDGDRLAWERFVARALEIFERHPGVRWVHWDSYEPLWISRYVDRLGAPEAFRHAMSRGCFDLKRELDRCVRLPLRSYSIKHVAPWMGFEWRNPDSGSEWSVAHFHRARETADPAERTRLLTELAEYNEDDLWAMRTVWRWLKENGPREARPAGERRRSEA